MHSAPRGDAATCRVHAHPSSRRRWRGVGLARGRVVGRARGWHPLRLRTRAHSARRRSMGRGPAYASRSDATRSSCATCATGECWRSVTRDLFLPPTRARTRARCVRPTARRRRRDTTSAGLRGVPRRARIPASGRHDARDPRRHRPLDSPDGRHGGHRSSRHLGRRPRADRGIWVGRAPTTPISTCAMC